MYSNCALRSGCLEPSSALRLCCREKPSLVNSARTVSALIGWPIAVSAAASLSMLFDTQVRGRMGSPRVTGSTKRLRAGKRPGSLAATRLRPPPLRRTFPSGSGSPSRSSSPRLIVERASPVILATVLSPPRPAVRTSAAANMRLARSSSFEPIASHRRRMPSSSIMPPRYDCSAKSGIPNPRVTRSHDRPTAIQLLFGVSLPSLEYSRELLALCWRGAACIAASRGPNRSEQPTSGGRDGRMLHGGRTKGWDQESPITPSQCEWRRGARPSFASAPKGWSRGRPPRRDRDKLFTFTPHPRQHRPRYQQEL